MRVGLSSIPCSWRAFSSGGQARATAEVGAPIAWAISDGDSQPPLPFRAGRSCELREVGWLSWPRFLAAAGRFSLPEGSTVRRAGWATECVARLPGALVVGADR